MSKLSELYQAFLGNFASSVWFFPAVCKLIHSIRGIRFSDRKSVFISSNVILDNRNPELISIGADVWLTHGVTVLSHSWCSKYQRKTFHLKEKTGEVVIEDGVFIGANSTILPGVTLGKGCYIGAGSVVIRDVPAGYAAAGNPSKVLSKISKKD
tara:strand:+ start:437 stop:898 length:462 start_codon:yes stop_codon:yes gene_type:complete